MKKVLSFSIAIISTFQLIHVHARDGALKGGLIGGGLGALVGGAAGGGKGVGIGLGVGLLTGAVAGAAADSNHRRHHREVIYVEESPNVIVREENAPEVVYVKSPTKKRKKADVTYSTSQKQQNITKSTPQQTMRKTSDSKVLQLEQENKAMQQHINELREYIVELEGELTKEPASQLDFKKTTTMPVTQQKSITLAPQQTLQQEK